LQAVSSESGALLDWISPLPNIAATSTKPIVCFDDDFLYIVDGTSVSQYFYNRTKNQMLNMWNRQGMPKGLEGSQYVIWFFFFFFVFRFFFFFVFFLV
jgi:hypothetical protein